MYVASIWLMLCVFLSVCCQYLVGVCCQYLVDVSWVSWCVASIWLMCHGFLGVCCQYLVDVSYTPCGLLPGPLHL